MSKGHKPPKTSVAPEHPARGQVRDAGKPIRGGVVVMHRTPGDEAPWEALAQACGQPNGAATLVVTILDDETLGIQATPEGVRTLPDPILATFLRLALQQQVDEIFQAGDSRYKAIVDRLEALIYISSAQNRLEYVNRRGREQWGLTDLEQKCHQAIFKFDQPCPWCVRPQVMNGQSVTQEFLYPADKRWYDLTATPVHFTFGEISLLTMVQDITARKQAEEMARRLAYTDALTGLPNRALFYDRLSMAMAQAQRYGQKLAVVMLDLNGFKKINDTLGHQVGDVLLQQVAKRLEGLLRRSDTVARYGGDEFISVLAELNGVEDDIIIAEKILDAFNRPFDFRGRLLQVTASLGVALFPDDGEDIDTLIQQADMAMYRVKKSGRNRYALSADLSSDT